MLESFVILYPQNNLNKLFETCSFFVSEKSKLCAYANLYIWSSGLALSMVLKTCTFNQNF